MQTNRTTERTTCAKALLGTAAWAAMLGLGSTAAWAQNRVIVIEEEALTVELEKPEAFYILSPSNLDYQSVDPEASFLDELYATVEEAPF